MRIITVINAKGGCGKSTIAMNLAAALAQDGAKVLLSDMDPQAQISEWLHASDGLSWEDTIVAPLLGQVPLVKVIHPTRHKNLSFIASAFALEEYGRDIVHQEGYYQGYANALGQLPETAFDFLIVDAPNQISPIMENTIFPADLFIVPFESTKAVKSYANFYSLLLQIRPGADFHMLHVLNNLHRAGLRKRVIERMHEEHIPIAQSEIRNCGWLAQVDEHGGSILEYRPRSKGAEDMVALCGEVLDLFNKKKRKKVANA
jgi:chromosome partitioning protein